MSEEKMEAAAQQALANEGIDDTVISAGQFNPRGHSGGMFVGGMAGDSAAGALGGSGIADAIGTVAGMAAGEKSAGEAGGLPQWMLVAVTANSVYGWDSRSRSKTPERLVFRVDRSDLEVKVHQRTNVRVLELIHKSDGSKIELEGNRLPITHSKDVIDHLQGG